MIFSSLSHYLSLLLLFRDSVLDSAGPVHPSVDVFSLDDALRIYFASKLYGHLPSRLSASFWLNAFVTMLILLGPAVEDSANGKDVYLAFTVRMGLFVAVTIYARAAIYILEYLRTWHAGRIAPPLPLSRS